MGQIVKQVSENTTRYFWYPGDKKEWLRAAIAVALGAIAYVALHLTTGQVLLPAVAGMSLTAAIFGMNFGRRDGRAMAELARPSTPLNAVHAKFLRRRAIGRSGRMAWRGVVQAAGGAAAAVAIVNLSPTGWAEKWLLPLVPAVVGAVAHQIGLLVQRLGHARTITGLAASTATTEPQRVAATASVDRIG
jgi:hypothetical protein